MKYIRVKDRIYKVEKEGEDCFLIATTIKPVCLYGAKIVKACTLNNTILKKEVIRQSDSIEELCDEFVVVCAGRGHRLAKIPFENVRDNIFNCQVDGFTELYGAIWTDKGLIYVAKMNEKGELELL